MTWRRGRRFIAAAAASRRQPDVPVGSGDDAVARGPSPLMACRATAVSPPAPTPDPATQVTPGPGNPEPCRCSSPGRYRGGEHRRRLWRVDRGVSGQTPNRVHPAPAVVRARPLRARLPSRDQPESRACGDKRVHSICRRASRPTWKCRSTTRTDAGRRRPWSRWMPSWKDQSRWRRGRSGRYVIPSRRERRDAKACQRSPTFCRA